MKIKSSNMDKKERKNIVANYGVERNKKPLKNMVYIVEIKKIKDPEPENLLKYKFKELGYLWLRWGYQDKYKTMFSHGLIEPEKLKEKLGEKQWSKFCQGKREFIIQRRIDGKNIKKK